MDSERCTTYRHCSCYFKLQRCSSQENIPEGVKKGAFDEAEAEKRFEAWLEEKSIQGRSRKRHGLSKAQEEAKAKALEAERATNEARIAANAPVEEAPVEEAPTEEVEAAAEEAPATEEAPAEEAPAAEATAEEAPAEEAPAEDAEETKEA